MGPRFRGLNSWNLLLFFNLFFYICLSDKKNKQDTQTKLRTEIYICCIDFFRSIKTSTEEKFFWVSLQHYCFNIMQHFPPLYGVVASLSVVHEVLNLYSSKVMIELVIFNCVDTFHEVKSKRERRKEVHCENTFPSTFFLYCLRLRFSPLLCLFYSRHKGLRVLTCITATKFSWEVL